MPAEIIVPGLSIAAGALVTPYIGPVGGAFVTAGASYLLAKAFGLGPEQLPTVAGELGTSLKTTTATPGTPMKIVYGERLVGGNLIFAEVSGDSNEFLHLVYGVCVGEIDSIGTVYLNEKDAEGDDWVSYDPYVHRFTGRTTSFEDGVIQMTINGDTYEGRAESIVHTRADGTRINLRAMSGVIAANLVKKINAAGEDYEATFKGVGDIDADVYVKRKEGTPALTVTASAITTGLSHSVRSEPTSVATITRFVGTDTQTYITALVSSVASSWTSAHTLKGIAGVYIKLRWDEIAFPAGLPNATFLINGRKVFDPRDSSTGLSDNPALCIRDYLTSDQGAAIASAVIDDTSINAAATYCSAQVSTFAGGAMQSRYTCNGALFTDVTIKNNLDMLLSSCRGVLIYRAGKYYLTIDKPEASTFDLTEDHIVGNWTLSPASRQTRTNRVRANFIDPDRNWEADVAIKDYASARTAEDNGLLLQKEVDLPFTTNLYTAEQIAHVELKQSRQGIVVEFDAHGSALNIAPMDVGTITHEMPGWTSKKFRVLETDLRENELVHLTCVEYEETTYDLETLSEKDASPDTNLPTDRTTSTVSIIEARSSTEFLGLDAGNSVVSRIFLTWDTPDDQLVTGYEVAYGIVSTTAGLARFSDRIANKENFVSSLVTHSGDIFITDRNTTQAYINNVVDGGKYLLMVRYKNTFGVTSPWVQTTHKVIGKSAVPSNVSAIIISIDDDRQVATWDLVPDLDVIKYEIRKGLAWSTAEHVAYTDTNKLILPQTDTGSQTYMVKAIDYYYQESVSAAISSITIDAAVVSSISENIIGQKYQLSWDTTKGSYPIDGYDIRHGSDWATGTRVAYVKSNVFSVVPDWTGTRTFWVAPEDVFDNYGDAIAVSAVITTPGSAVINVETLGEDVLLEWNMDAGTFAIKQYDLRRGAQTWASAESVGLFNTTSHRVNVNWEDEETFLIRGYDLLGNEGVVTIVSAAVSKPQTPSISHTFLGGSIVLTWTEPASDINVVEYEIKRGEVTDTYASATLIGSIKTTVFQEEVNYGGAKRYFVKAINAAGVASDEGTSDAEIIAPTITIDNINVIDNNVLLYWTTTAGTLPIAHANLYRSIATESYASATLIGEKDGTFTSIFETVADEYAYYIEAQDTGGNAGDYAVQAAVVNEPPDFVFQNEFNSTFTSTKTNFFKQLDGKLVGPVDLVQDWSSHFVDNGWSNISTQIASGYPIYAQPSKTSALYQEVFDTGAVVATSRITVSKIFSVLDGGVTLSPTIEARSSTGASWDVITSTQWQGYANNFRYIRATVEAGADDDTSIGLLEALNVKVDSKITTESGNVSFTSSFDTLKIYSSGGSDTGWAKAQSLHANGSGHGTWFSGPNTTFECELKMNPPSNVTSAWSPYIMFAAVRDASAVKGYDAYFQIVSSNSYADNWYVKSYVRATMNMPHASGIPNPARDDLAHHYALSWDEDAKTARVYLDGNLLSEKSSTSASAITNAASGLLVIGNYDGTSYNSGTMRHRNANGEYKFARVYSTALTSSEVVSNFSAGKDGTYVTSKLFNFYDMTADTSTILASTFTMLVDQQGNQNLKLDGEATIVSATADFGQRIYFTKNFIDINSITVTPKAQQDGITAIYDFLDVPYPKSFIVYLLDINGNKVNGDFSWTVRGFI